MPSSISSSSETAKTPSRYLSVVSFLTTFFVLMLGWELVIRSHYNPAVARVVEAPPAHGDEIDPEREWLVFGNCLVLNGISPEVFHDVWHEERPEALLPRFRNLAKHEYAPQAYLSYLRQNNYYPEVVVFNVSSWLNSDNFQAEAVQLEKEDLLGIRDGAKGESAEFVVGTTEHDDKTFQGSVESALHGHLSKVLRMSEKNYHLFDFGMFLRSLVTSRDLNRSLYQLQIQSWYKLKAQHRDGHGQMAFEVGYSTDWEQALAIMTEKQLSRMRLGNFLTKSFWGSLETEIGNFRKHGTRVVLLRMPEHPEIHRFNEATYSLSKNMRELANRTNAELLDINDDPEFMASIQLYDGVHPDQRGSIRISRYVAKWIGKQQPSWVFSTP